MCGIIGVASSKTVDAELMRRLRDRLRHRGPDDSGLWIRDDERVVLGHRRLSILDLSLEGSQPMQSANGRYIIVYNGEIYNYIEIRTELEALGHIFKSTGDTEVILASYVEWGELCLKRFNGMFAIVIYDKGDQFAPASLFFARDRVGKKPLYISHCNGAIAFASELKAIPDNMHGGINIYALNFYLALGYIPAALCILKGVCKLQAGYAARYEINSDKLTQWRWWSLPKNIGQNAKCIEEQISETEALLHDSVRMRLRSDVPVGVMLSGGLDSSLLVASAARSTSKVKTFTVSFPGTRLDESKYADIVASHFDTDHHVLNLSQPSLSVIDELKALIDEPLADSSIIPSYMISKLAAQHVKVALGGDGGDELFGGYSDYAQALADYEKLKYVPNIINKAVSSAAGMLPTGVRGRNRLYSLRGGAFQSLVWGTPYFDAVARRRILSSDVIAELGNEFMAPEQFKLGLYKSGIDPIDSMTRTHFGSILIDDFLVKVDRASMAVGLEMRCPLLDYRLVEYAFGKVPGISKVTRQESRLLQKRVAKNILPEKLDLNRKQGFSMPINDWFRDIGSNGFLNDVRDLPAVINQTEVRKILDGHIKGRENGGRLFALLMFKLSCKNLGINC